MSWWRCVYLIMSSSMQRLIFNNDYIYFNAFLKQLISVFLAYFLYGCLLYGFSNSNILKQKQQKLWDFQVELAHTVGVRYLIRLHNEFGDFSAILSSLILFLGISTLEILQAA